MKIELPDELTGVTHTATVSRNRQTRPFHAVLAASSRPMTSPPLRLGGDSWSEAKEAATTLLYMARAAHRYSLGIADYGLTGTELEHAAHEVPAFAAQCVGSVLGSPAGDDRN